MQVAEKGPVGWSPGQARTVSKQSFRSREGLEHGQKSDRAQAERKERCGGHAGQGSAEVTGLADAGQERLKDFQGTKHGRHGRGVGPTESDDPRQGAGRDGDSPGASRGASTNAVQSPRQKLESVEVDPSVEVGRGEVAAGGEHGSGEKRPKRGSSSGSGVSVCALETDPDHHEDRQGLGAERSEEKRQKKRRRGKSALGRAKREDPSAIVGVPERQLAEVQDRVHGVVLVRHQDLRIAEKVHRACGAQRRPRQRQGDNAKDAKPQWRRSAAPRDRVENDGQLADTWRIRGRRIRVRVRLGHFAT